MIAHGHAIECHHAMRAAAGVNVADRNDQPVARQDDPPAQLSKLLARFNSSQP